MIRHSGTLYIYWIWSVGHMGQHTGKKKLADELLGFKSKHRATIYVYWIWRMSRNENRGSELGTWAGTQAQ